MRDIELGLAIQTEKTEKQRRRERESKRKREKEKAVSKSSFRESEKNLRANDDGGSRRELVSVSEWQQLILFKTNEHRATEGREY